MSRTAAILQIQIETAELAQALDSAAVAPSEKAHLAETTAHLLQSLHQQRDRGLLTAARERLEEAVAKLAERRDAT